MPDSFEFFRLFIHPCPVLMSTSLVGPCQTEPGSQGCCKCWRRCTWTTMSSGWRMVRSLDHVHAQWSSSGKLIRSDIAQSSRQFNSLIQGTMTYWWRQPPTCARRPAIRPWTPPPSPSTTARWATRTTTCWWQGRMSLAATWRRLGNYTIWAYIGRCYHFHLPMCSPPGCSWVWMLPDSSRSFLSGLQTWYTPSCRCILVGAS